MDPIKKLWMFYNWVEDQKEKIEITKNHAYLIGSFINPEAVKKLMGEGNTIQSSEEEFEESIKMVKNNKINLNDLIKNNIKPTTSTKRKKRRKIKD
jgi:hypothetical protein